MYFYTTVSIKRKLLIDSGESFDRFDWNAMETKPQTHTHLVYTNSYVCTFKTCMYMYVRVRVCMYVSVCFIVCCMMVIQRKVMMVVMYLRFNVFIVVLGSGFETLWKK